eukprot:6627320-Prymnesium_polylepis.1
MQRLCSASAGGSLRLCTASRRRRGGAAYVPPMQGGVAAERGCARRCRGCARRCRGGDKAVVGAAQRRRLRGDPLCTPRRLERL